MIPAILACFASKAFGRSVIAITGRFYGEINLEKNLFNQTALAKVIPKILNRDNGMQQIDWGGAIALTRRQFHDFFQET